MGVKVSSSNDRQFKNSLSAMSKLIPQAINIFTQVMESMPEKDRPDEASIEFGVVLSSDADAYLAKSTSENTLKITLFWTSEDN